MPAWVTRWISTTRWTPAAPSIPASRCSRRLWRWPIGWRGVSGRDLLLAVALGLTYLPHRLRQHLGSRLAPHRGDRGVRRHGGRRQTDRALTAEQMLHAFGIAYSHAAGNRQCILDGALTKRLQAGQAASAGVFSAVLAQTGFTGARQHLQRPFRVLGTLPAKRVRRLAAPARPRAESSAARR